MSFEIRLKEPINGDCLISVLWSLDHGFGSQEYSGLVSKGLGSRLQDPDVIQWQGYW